MIHTAFIFSTRLKECCISLKVLKICHVQILLLDRISMGSQHALRPLSKEVRFEPVRNHDRISSQICSCTDSAAAQPWNGLPWTVCQPCSYAHQTNISSILQLPAINVSGAISALGFCGQATSSRSHHVQLCMVTLWFVLGTARHRNAAVHVDQPGNTPLQPASLPQASVASSSSTQQLTSNLQQLTASSLSTSASVHGLTANVQQLTANVQQIMGDSSKLRHQSEDRLAASDKRLRQQETTIDKVKDKTAEVHDLKASKDGAARLLERQVTRAVADALTDGVAIQSGRYECLGGPGDLDGFVSGKYHGRAVVVMVKAKQNMDVNYPKAKRELVASSAYWQELLQLEVSDDADANQDLNASQLADYRALQVGKHRDHELMFALGGANCNAHCFHQVQHLPGETVYVMPELSGFYKVIDLDAK